MEIYSKMFLLNILLIVVAALVDSKLLDDCIEKGGVTGIIFGAWSMATLISVPVYFFLLILTA